MEYKKENKLLGVSLVALGLMFSFALLVLTINAPQWIVNRIQSFEGKTLLLVVGNLLIILVGLTTYRLYYLPSGLRMLQNAYRAILFIGVSSGCYPWVISTLQYYSDSNKSFLNVDANPTLYTAVVVVAVVTSAYACAREYARLDKQLNWPGGR